MCVRVCVREFVRVFVRESVDVCASCVHVQRNVLRCGAVRCGAVRCGAVLAVRCGVRGVRGYGGEGVRV